ncbi:hypothetical protein BaRGS_00009676, partial [Batillaria attramentaria]
GRCIAYCQDRCSCVSFACRWRIRQECVSQQKKETWVAPPSPHQAMMAKIGRIEERLDALEKHVGLKGEQERELRESKAEVAEVRVAMQETLRKLAVREQELTETRYKVDNLTNQSEADRRKIKDLEEAKKRLEETVKDLEKQLQRREQKVKQLETELSAMKEELKTTQTQVKKTNARVKKFENQVKEQDEKMNDILRRIEHLSPRPPDSEPSSAPVTDRHLSGTLQLPPIKPPSNAKMNFPPLRK